MKLIDSDKYNAVKLVNYDEYNEKRSPRSIVVDAVMNATGTGLFLGVLFIGAIERRDAWHWAWPLAMALMTGARAIQSTLVALHNCPPSTKTPQDESVPHTST
jgi:hypothetical protein